MPIYTQDEFFLIVGKIFSLSIINGGPGPSFLSRVVVDYLFGGVTAVKATVEDIIDDEVKAKIEKVCGKM